MRWLLCLLFLGVLSAGEASAQTYSSIGRCDYNQGCTREQAWTEINASTAFCNRWSVGATASTQSAPTRNGTAPQYIAKYKCQPANPNASSSVFYVYTVWHSDCPAGQQFFESTGSCSNSCSSRPSTSALFSGTGGTCIAGCEFVVDISAPGSSVTSYDVAGKRFTRASALTPTGNSCVPSSDQTPPDVDACVQQGSLTQCIKPDGRTCARSSSGKLFCYDVSESGAKSSGNEATVITPDGVEAKPPNTPPKNGGEWVKVGEGTISTTVDGVTTTKTVTTYVSNYGTQGSNTGAEGDNDEGENEGIKASTGEGCEKPSFQCSDMSSVECNQLIQTWYLRCKGKQINGGATCDAPPTCDGSSTDCFIGLQLWNFRCDGKQTTDSDGAALSTFDAQVNTEGDGTDEPDAADMPLGNGNTSDMGIWEERKVSDDLSKLNSSGFLGGSGSCPQLPTVTVGGAGLHFNLNPICELLRNVGVMVMALAYWLAYRIIAKVKT